MPFFDIAYKPMFLKIKFIILTGRFLEYERN
jgi:hypothetical protein